MLAAGVRTVYFPLMIPPALQQVLLLIESLLRFIEAEYCPPLRVLGIPLFRLPSARTRAAAQLRRLADEIAAIAATLPTLAPTPLLAPHASTPAATTPARKEAPSLPVQSHLRPTPPTARLSLKSKKTVVRPTSQHARTVMF